MSVQAKILAEGRQLGGLLEGALEFVTRAFKGVLTECVEACEEGWPITRDLADAIAYCTIVAEVGFEQPADSSVMPRAEGEFTYAGIAGTL